MGPVLRLVAHIAEHEHRGRAPRDSSDEGGNGGRLPWWAILLVVYVLVFSLLFFSSLTYYWKRENEHKKGGQPFRTGKVLWNAFSVAAGLWTWIWVFKKRGWCGSSRNGDHPARVGTYEKIEARRTPPVVRVSAPAPGTTSAPTTSPWYGTPVNKSTTHAPYAQPNNMIKSPPYNSTYQGFVQHDSFQMSVLSPSPNPSPSHTPLPPYMSSPPPVALYGQGVQPRYTGSSY
ncbi:hypothetical protein F5B21DRAFT_509833 [Xylaria acuta]|nr:hypothetical protein F5B21DRAFT_509833 [Xylaria acuta]